MEQCISYRTCNMYESITAYYISNGFGMWYKLITSLRPSIQAGTIIALFVTGTYRRRRSASEDLADPVYLIMATVSRLDTHGCILKLLCQLRADSPDNLSAEERIIVEIFADHVDLFAKNGAGESSALGEDGQLQIQNVCTSSADRCPIAGDLLRNLSRHVWGSSLFWAKTINSWSNNAGSDIFKV